MKNRNSVFEYTNYREFLSDTYRAMKTANKGFSFRVFSRMGGFKAGNILKLVMDGKRNLTPDSIEKFCKALKLNKEETSFFTHLVLFNQAKTSEEKAEHAEILTRSRCYRKIHPVAPAQFRYFSQWYFIPIREMVRLPGFKEDYEWIAGRISPPIKPADAKKAVEELLLLGILKRGENGGLQLSELAVSSGNDVTFAGLGTFHKEMLKRCSESIDRVPRDKREINSMTFTVSAETFKKIKEMANEFRTKVVETITHDPQQPDAVYQMSLYCFPLVEMMEGEKK